MTVSVGIFAHNEERLIEPVVRGYLDQTAHPAVVREIVVLSCGSTDGTDAAVERLAADDRRLRLMRRPSRLGKIAALEDFSALATGDVLVFASADVIPSRDLVEQLVRPLWLDPGCGMTGPRVEPGMLRGDLTSRMHAVLWLMHHQVNLRHPKLGEVVAVRARHLGGRFPAEVHCDEVLLEAQVLRSSATLRYVPDTHVVNFAPRSAGEFFTQRRRIACQHIAARRVLGYAPATSRVLPILVAGAALARENPRQLTAAVPLAVLEAVARLGGRWDYRRGRRYGVWSLVERPLVANVPVQQAPVASPFSRADPSRFEETP